MSYVALYNKFRPLIFDDVVEQKHIVETLKNSVIRDRIANAYLFCGTRGTGKTTVARIYARAINCLNPINGNPCNQCSICEGILSGSILDVSEIDAASNNSVDNIRNIRDEVMYTPSNAKYKVYIIDEVHMLSTGAFNALLKTLEEPPKRVVFFLATTEPHKLPATILSRCQRFDFKRISIESIISHITDIAAMGGVRLENNAARLIARLSDGAMRDAISLIDQCITQGKEEIVYNDVLTVTGIVHDDFISEFVDNIIKRDVATLIILIDKLVMEGKDVNQFALELVKYYRNLLLCKTVEKPEELLDIPLDALSKMSKQCGEYGRYEIIQIINELSSLESRLKWASQPRVLLEVELIKICESNFNTEGDALSLRIAALEEKVGQLSRGMINIKGENASTDNNKVKENLENEFVDDSYTKDSPFEEIKQKAPPLRALEKKTVLKDSESQNGKSIDGWNQIIDRLMESGKMVMYTNLLDTDAVLLSDKQVGIIFKTNRKFNKAIVSKAENLEAIRALLVEKLGYDVSVKCIDEEELISKPVEYTQNDDILKKAKKIAKELNVPFKIIDE